MIMPKFFAPGPGILAAFLVAAGSMATAPEVEPTTAEVIPSTVRVLTVNPAPFSCRPAPRTRCSGTPNRVSFPKYPDAWRENRQS